MDAEPGESLDVVERDSVVEILRIDRIDREHVPRAQVTPVGLLQRAFDIGAQPARLLERLERELRGQPGVVDDDVDVHARGIRTTERLHDVAFHRNMSAGEGRDLGEHDVAIVHLGCPFERDEQVVLDTWVLRHDNGERVGKLQDAHDEVGRAVQHTTHRCRAPVAVSLMRRVWAHLDDVAGKRAARAGCRNVERPFLGVDKAVSGSGDLDFS